jgi:hypothetical protein
MSLFERPILIYSDYCPHSDNFIKILMRHPNLFKDFIRMNIDVNPETKKRPQIFYQIQQELNQKITKVPTIIVNENSQLYILSDKDAFKWLDYKTKPKREESLTPFNPNEMGSFSDMYSKFGSTELNDATEQNYKFYQEVDGQRFLPGEDFYCSGPIQGPESFKESDEISSNKTFENIQAERSNFEQEIQQNIQNTGNVNITPQSSSQDKINNYDYNSKVNKYKQESSLLRGSSNQQKIDFTNPQFGLAGSLNNGQRQPVSSKQKDLDAKLQQLLLDRQN